MKGATQRPLIVPRSEKMAKLREWSQKGFPQVKRCIASLEPQ